MTAWQRPASLTVAPEGTNIRDLADAAGLRVYDTALPLGWYEDVHRVTGEWPQTLGFVWCYDSPSVWGEPFPLTDAAAELLEQYASRENLCSIHGIKRSTIDGTCTLCRTQEDE